MAIHDDIRFLKKVRKFSPAGFVDLQKFVKDFGIQSSGLKKLTAIVLGFRISKRQQVTDWEAEELSEPQQIYAATDAWVCREIYKKMIQLIDRKPPFLFPQGGNDLHAVPLGGRLGRGSTNSQRDFFQCHEPR